MNENPLKKCRTCLKNSTKTYPLTKNAAECNTKATYGQLLQEYAKLEYPADYEHLMPQNLCALCCRELSNAYTFIRQAQYCNNKLVNLIAKQLQSLQEKAIVLPHKGNELKNSLGIKLDKNSDKINDCILQPTIRNEFRIVSTSALLNSVELVESIENHGYNHEPIQRDVDRNIQKEINKGVQNESNNFNLESNTICPICGKPINRYDNLLTHMRTQHDIEAPSKYLKIQEPAQVNYAININKIGEEKVNQKAKNKVIKCSSCFYTARTYSALNFHVRSKHGSEEDKFKCQFCAYMSLKKFSLFIHVKKSHKQLIRTLRADAANKLDQSETLCNDTSRGLTFDSALKEQHYFLVGNENSSSIFSTSSAQEVTKSPPKIIPNSEIYEDQEELIDEMFIRNILKMEKRLPLTVTTKFLPRRCDECGNIYNNLRALKTHIKKVHSTEHKLCPQCGKKLKGRANLKRHIENAHSSETSTEITKKPAIKIKEKRFMCTKCSYVCSTISLLKIHESRHHTGEKPYKCDICFKAFAVAFTLKIHRYLHTGERPYKCSVCLKCFRCSPQLIKHKRIHNNERPYKCKECDKSFTQSYNLTLHKRTHLREKKLNCMICDKLFENKSLLNMHRISENHHDEVD